MSKKDMEICLVGSYLHDIYVAKNQLKISGKKEHFHYVLGWYINNYYPNQYDQILNIIKKEIT